ncbi:MAG: AEC family transporter [Bacillus sp. (in: Bacteria)]|nr:AEC family transporter [Bacillus sp. (in: firmicutes)]MCM1425049.1 AEC family transporter [Eubacterium sp.]
MSISVVLEQMIIIMILIIVGIFLFRKKMLSEDTSRQLSGLIVNVTNPAVLICSAFDDSPKVSLSELGVGLCVVLVSYAVLLLFAYLIPLILRVPQPGRYSYRMLTIFGNVGFIGIPLVSAVLGSGALIFVSLNNLVYNVLVYTYGIATLKKAAVEQHAITQNDSSESLAHKLINAGTVSAVLTIIFYLGNFNVPAIISSSLSYAGRTTTFLSMLVLGVSVAQMAPKEIFSHPKLYAFTLIRQILLPVGFTLVIGLFVHKPLIVNSAALMLAVPAGNMPLMLSKQLHVDESTISQGIILTTILSLATIPVVAVFIA